MRRTRASRSSFVIGVTDTMFARGDMAQVALDAIRALPEFKAHDIHLPRVTVPGFKDLPAAVCQLFEKDGADVVMAFGYAGSEPIDEVCSHEASLGLMACRVKYGKPVIEVFVHHDEGLKLANNNPKRGDELLARIMRERARKHAINAVKMLTDPAWLTRRAGTGQRQGWTNVKPLKL